MTKKRYERTEPVLLDVSESPERLDDLIKSHNVVISLLPWTLHPVVAKKCIANKTGTYLIHLDYITLNLSLQIFSLLTDMVTASYCTPAMQDLHKDALEAGITIVNEVSIYSQVSIKPTSLLNSTEYC